MQRRIFLQSLVFLPAINLLACSQNPKFAQLPKNTKVVALGDSLTFGYGANQGQDYPTHLAALTGWQIDNMGVNGDTSQNVLDRLDSVIAKKPTLVLLGIGGNDVLRRIKPEITQNNISTIIQKLKNHSILVVLIAQPHFSASALLGKASDNPIYAKIAKAEQIPLFADGWSTILSDKTLKSDTIHANAQGYAQFAQLLFAFLQKIGYA